MTKQSLPAPETIEVSQTRLACDGDGGALGHPKVYLEMGDDDFVECGYCDRRFVLSREAREARAKGEALPH
ncbi:MAG: zinc-finger domain-containing protein [Methylocystis sp.]